MINFKKISAFGTTALMMGMTMGMAAAASYPAPFVSGGLADVAVVYGTGAGVSVLDAVEAGNLQSNLQSFMGASTSAGSTSTTGETVSLDTGSTRIWLNTSLNTAKSTITKTDMPTTLKDYTFSGNVDSKLTQTIKIGGGFTAGAENSGKVIFAKQPTSSSDPVIGLSMNTSQTGLLYNASVTMSAINFTHADSKNQEITLFGQKYTVASATDLTKLVLLKSATKVSLSNTSPTADVTVGGKTYTLTLVSASDTAATIKVTDSAGMSDSKEVSEGASKKIQGLQIAITTADELGSGAISTTLSAGSEKITLENGATVTKGDNADPIDGTFAYIVGSNSVGTTNATTEIAVAVYRPDSSNDAILPGATFVDPVFGSFKIDFAGLSSPSDDVTRDTVTFVNSGDKAMALTMTDSDSNTKTVIVAYNATYAGGLTRTLAVNKSANWRLSDDNNNSIWVIEGANLTENSYELVGNQDYGHLVQVTQIYNSTGTDYTTDKVKFKDVMSGSTYDSTFTSEGVGSVSIDGKQYTVRFVGSGSDGYVTLKYPTGDSPDANSWVVYPTIDLKGGSRIALYEPLNISLGLGINGTTSAVDKLYFPDGDGYTSLTLTYTAGTGGLGNWTLSGAAASVLATDGGSAGTASGVNYSSFTIGQLTYNLTNTTVINSTRLWLMQPGSTNNQLTSPAVVIFEEKDNNNNYEAVVISTEEGPEADYLAATTAIIANGSALPGTSTNGVGVDLVAMSTKYYNASATMQSKSDITKYIDWFGVLTSVNAADSDQKTANLSIPPSQLYAKLYLGASGSNVTSSSSGASASSLGDVLVKDSEVSSVSSKNLIVVGGSCINSAAAKVLGGAYCGASFTGATNVSSGQFLIQSVADKYTTGKVALVVAGYDAADTVNAAKYLRTKTVDTMAGKKYVGTSSTSATLVVG